MPCLRIPSRNTASQCFVIASDSFRPRVNISRRSMIRCGHAMPPHRDLRDPVHGFIRIEGRECDVVDTPVFQRLRRIKQLALAHLVYPGAVHNRLEHTLGVMHVAGRLCEKLDIDPEKRRLIRLAALLHDIGHGPFSHPSEEVLSALAADELSDSSATDKIHELITREIIRTDQDLGKLISARDRGRHYQASGSGAWTADP